MSDYRVASSFAEHHYPDHGRAVFFECLTHDDRGSFYHIARSDPRADSPAGQWKGFSRSAKYLGEFDFEKGFDWYVTRNGFSSKLSRESKFCRQLNSFLFDIDFHDASDNPETLTCNAFDILANAWNAGKIPVPTMVISTGRGLHLYYILNRSTSVSRSDGSPNDKGIKYFRDIEERLCRTICDTLSAIPSAKVDRSVFDSSRVSRVPGTVNSKNGKTCELIFSTGKYHSLAHLSSTLPSLPSRKTKKGRGVRKFARRGPASQLSSCRLSKIKELQKQRSFDNEGNRELMCFCYYNAAVQVFEARADAFDDLRDFNFRFKKPLSLKELTGIKTSVDKVGFYRLSTAKISSFLNLSENEAISTGFFMTKRDIDREEAKALTRSNRNARNRRIRFLNKIKGISKSDIAKLSRCSTSTIYNILSTHEVSDTSITLEEATRIVLDYRTITPKGITTNNTGDNILETPLSVSTKYPFIPSSPCLHTDPGGGT